MIRILLALIMLYASHNAMAKRHVVQKAPDSITIMASSSLTNVMSELITQYSIDKQLSMIAIYDSPTELEYKIEEGDVADLYIGEHPVVMRDLKRSGALNVFNISDVAQNQLVLIASHKSRLSKEDFSTQNLKDILQSITLKTLLHIAEPDSTWLGHVTKTVLTHLDQWHALSRFLVRIASARNTLYLIDKGQSVGIVYHTDALTNKNVKILASIDPTLHEPIIYKTALIAGDNMERATVFVNYLQSEPAQIIFKKHGFLIPNAK